MRHLFSLLLALVMLALPMQATAGPVQDLLQQYRSVIEKSSRKTIGPAIDALAGSGLSEAQAVLQTWQAKNMWQRKADGLFFIGENCPRRTIS